MGKFEFLRSLDVLAAPTPYREPKGLFAMEAMACGVPVVATPVGGVLDVVKDRENGMLIPVNDIEAMAKTIQRVMDDSILRETISKSARRTIMERFTPEKELKANLEIYRNLAAR